jgi:uncharacterized protein (DUF1501 family)
MDRRDFLGWAAASGLGLLLPPRRARASGSSYSGPYWITVHAEGGWDPTCLCDPKGGQAGKRESINQSYAPEQIGRAGCQSYAPISLSLGTETNSSVEVYSAKRFFETHGSRFLVVNGIDTSTNNHETGRRVIWSGRSAEGYPSIGALAAASIFEKTPASMAFLSYGGYDITAGSVPLTRASNVDNLWRVAYPNRINPKSPDAQTFHTAATADRIAKAQAARTQRLLAQEPLPVVRRALSSLLSVRQGDAGLADIARYLPEKLIGIDDMPDLNPIAAGQRNRVNELQNFVRQAQLSLAAFQGGVAVSASLVLGGFDTHGDHDNTHIPRLVQLLRGVDYLLTQAKALGLDDKLYVMIGSDFGRTPYYNAGNGKDHWAVTSMLLSGPGIVGGRVIGGTDATFQPLKFDPRTLQARSTGTRIQPVHLHHAIRKLGGLQAGDVAARFPLPGEALPFFA